MSCPGRLGTGLTGPRLFFKSYRNISVEIKDQSVESLSTSFSSGYSVRVIKNNRMGFSFSTDIGEFAEVVRRRWKHQTRRTKTLSSPLLRTSPASEVRYTMKLSRT